MKTKSDKTTPRMAAASHAHPGLEMDSKGNPIPMEDRLPEDREKVHRARRSSKTASSKKKARK
jgi:hypothetical protein